MNRVIQRLAALTCMLMVFLGISQQVLEAAPPKADLSNASVTMPLSELKALMGTDDSARAPVDYVFGAATATATVQGKVATVRTQLELTLLTDNWVQVPVGAAKGLISATVDGETALLVQREENTFVLLNGKAKPKATLLITAERSVVADGPMTRVDLALPQVPLVGLTVTIPQGDIEMRALEGAGTTVSEKAGQTTLTTNYRGGQPAIITWRAKPAAGKQLPAKVSATTLTRVAVSRGVVRYLAQISYEIRHAEVDTFKIALPPDVEFTKATGHQVRDTQIITSEDGKTRTLVVTLAEAAQDAYELTVLYEQRFEDKDIPTVALLRHLDTASERGSIGLEVRGGGYELIPAVQGAQRIDVEELPQGLWSSARSPLLFGYRYDSPTDVKMTLGLTRHEDVDVLVAVSDVCEAATTITSDGKAITKAMYVTRNNLKQFMTLQLPKDAQLWSAFVDDRPVTPVRDAKGQTLIPLKKSESVDPDDEESYRAVRERRRAGDSDRFQTLHREKLEAYVEQEEPTDLAPYDVEIVYVMPAKKFESRGQLEVALPKSDVPIGKVAWAIFLPNGTHVMETQGNVNEVSAFTLGFPHFADAALAEQHRASLQMAKEMAMAAQMAQQQMALAEAVGASAKAQGVLPVRVDIPISGGITRFEKLLTVDEAPTVTLLYYQKAN